MAQDKHNGNGDTRPRSDKGALPRKSATRERVTNYVFDTSVKIVLDMLRKAGNAGVSMDQILERLSHVLDEMPKEAKIKKSKRPPKIPDVETVYRIFNYISDNDCDYVFYRVRGVYCLLDATWQAPLRGWHLSYADKIALQIGWDILKASIGAAFDAKESRLAKLYKKTMEELEEAEHTAAGLKIKQTIFQSAARPPLGEKNFLDLNFALTTRKCIVLNLKQSEGESTTGVYLVQGLELKEDGWHVRLAPSNTPEKEEEHNIDEISGTDVRF